MSSGATRRRFTKNVLVGAAAASSELGAPAVLGAGLARVVVVGGGAGGASLARYLARASRHLAVTLVNDKAVYTSSFFSNHTIAGLRTAQSIAWRYDRLGASDADSAASMAANTAPIEVAIDRAVAADLDNRVVVLAGGARLAYDALVLAPGIELRFEAIDGYSPEAAKAMPHAWLDGAETAGLRAQLAAMDDDGSFLICPPANPYRCPPAPYERASLAAQYFTTNKPNATILIVDAKNSFSMQDLFEEAWSRLYPGMIEWLSADFSGGGIKAVDAGSRTVFTDDEAFTASVVSVIPPQRAGQIAASAGLVDDSGWCPVDPLTFASKMAPHVHVIGDAASAGEMPKSAYSANRQARVCADAILQSLGLPVPGANALGNTCYSFLAKDRAIKVGASYRASAAGIARDRAFISDIEESEDERAATAREAEAWYADLTAEMFG